MLSGGMRISFALPQRSSNPKGAARVGSPCRPQDLPDAAAFIESQGGCELPIVAVKGGTYPPQRSSNPKGAARADSLIDDGVPIPAAAFIESQGGCEGSLPKLSESKHFHTWLRTTPRDNDPAPPRSGHRKGLNRYPLKTSSG